MLSLRQIIYAIPLLFAVASPSVSISQDSAVVSRIFTYCLEQGKSYERLRHLSFAIGNRLSGSANAEKAVQWSLKTLKEEQYANCYLQEVMVPVWVRNDVERLTLLGGKKSAPLSVFSLGGSIATPVGGIKAGVVEVRSFEELEKLGRDKIEGKMVFYNTPMKQRFYHTFEASSGRLRTLMAV